jgi:hypothetical protein
MFPFEGRTVRKLRLPYLCEFLKAMLYITLSFPDRKLRTFELK